MEEMSPICEVEGNIDAMFGELRCEAGLVGVSGSTGQEASSKSTLPRGRQCLCILGAESLRESQRTSPYLTYRVREELSQAGAGL